MRNTPQSKTALKRRRKTEEEEEWRPEGGTKGSEQRADVEEEEEEEENDEEGVPEGEDSILRNPHPFPSDADKMDTIARYASHPYYLRSLHQPEKNPTTFARWTKSHLQLPSATPIVGGASASASAAVLYSIPVPVLPPPPMPRGTSAACLFESLDTRDKEMRKSEGGGYWEEWGGANIRSVG